MTRQERRMRVLCYELCAVALVQGHTDLDGADRIGLDVMLPVFSVGRTAQLVSVHAQTLRQYDRQGIIVPGRTEGGARRYSLRDIERLVQAQHLGDEGVNLAGIARILDLQEDNRQLRRRIKRLQDPQRVSVFSADADGGIVEIQQSDQMRVWIRNVHTRMRELPASHNISHDSQTDMRSVILWGSGSIHEII